MSEKFLQAREADPEATCAAKEAANLGEENVRAKTDILEVLEPFLKVSEKKKFYFFFSNALISGVIAFVHKRSPAYAPTPNGTRTASCQTNHHPNIR